MRPAALALLLSLAACRRDPPPPTSQPQADASASASAEAVPSGAHVLDEGKDPRALVAFAFVPGRREARVLEIDSLLERSGKIMMNEHVELRFELRYTAADSIELTLRRASTTAADIPDLSSTLGARVAQKLGSAGTTEVPQVTFPAGANGTASKYVEGAVTQIASMFLPPVPSTPIGEGARWRWGGDGPLCRLVSRRDAQIVVERTSGMHGPRRLDTGKTIEVDEEQSSRIEAPVDGIARHVEALLVAGRSGGTKRTTRMRFDVIDQP